MTISIISTLQNYYTQAEPHQDERSPHCTLRWRRGQLLAKVNEKIQQSYLPSLKDEQLLVECLKHSPVSLVSIDPKLGEAWLRLWAKACQQAHKPLFLGLPSRKLPKQGSWLQRIIDCIIAVVLLFLLSPIILGLIVLMQVQSPGSIFSREWHIGVRGKLFQAIKFRTTTQHNVTFLGGWMRKYGLDNLPLLLNVLRGEMSFIESRCLTLEEALRLSLEGEKRFNKLPGMKKSWEVQTDSKQLHLDSQTL